MKKNLFNSFRPVLFSIVFITIGLESKAFSQATYYWDGNGATTGSGATTLTGNWGGGSASAFWGTSNVGTSATTAAAITASDTVVFAANDAVGANNYNSSYTVTLGTAQSVAGLVFNGASVGSGNTGGTLTLAGTGSPGLGIGAGGVILNGTNGDPTFATSLGTITLTADQTWTVNAAHVWKVDAAVAGNASAGSTRTWTLGYLNAFTNSYSGVISNGAGGGELALTLNNTNGSTTGGGTNSITGIANTYTGKTTISQGILQIASIKNVGGGSSSLGAVTTVANGTIDMGSGANSATLTYNGSSASTTDRVLNFASTTGGITIRNDSSSATNTVAFTSAVTNATGVKTLTLRGSNTGNNTFSGAIGDAADASKLTLVKTDAGVWVLGGSNAYSGGTTISGGTLAVSSAGTLGSNVVGNNIVISGGNLLLSSASNFGINQSITVNSGGIGVGYTPASLPSITDNTGTTGGVYGINYSGTGAVTSLSTLYNGNWFLGSFTTGTYTGSSLAVGNSSKYRLGGGGGVLTIQNSVLTGANDLLVGGTGGGTVIMSGANTYTGKTTLQNGTLSVSSLNKVSGGTASSSLGAPTTAGNGTIDIGSGSNAVTFNYTGSGEATDRILNFTGTTGVVTFTNTGTGNLVFNSAATFTGSGAKSYVLGSASDTYGGSLGAIVNNGGTATVTKNGLTNSTWTLSGTNTYTGDTTINGGVLSAPDLLSSSYIKLNGSGATTMAVFQSQGTLTRTLSSTSNASNLAWATFSGFAAKGGKLTLNFNSTAQLLWGTTSSFMGTGTSPMVFGSTTADNQVELLNAISLNTTDAFNRVIYVEKGIGGDSALLSGVISQGVAAGSNNGIVKDGKGALILSGTNTYGGATIIRAGTLVAGSSSLSGSSGALGLGTGSTAAPTAPSTIQLGDGITPASSNPSLQIGGAFTVSRNISINDNGTSNTYSIGGSTSSNATFSGAITVANGTANNNTFSITQVASGTLNITGGITGAANVNTKTVKFDNAGAVNVSTAAIADGAGGGKVAVIQSGAGTTTFSATNTYTGTTNITGGTLVIDGNQSSATGTVTVASGATLKGIGTIGGATTVQSGGIHAPGNSPGIEKFTSDLTYADGSIFAWDIDRTQTGRGTAYDAVNVTGALAGSDGADPGTTFDAVFRIVIGDTDFTNSFWSSNNHTWTDIFTGADGTTAKTNWAGIFGGGFQYYNSNGSVLSSAPTTGSFSLSGNTLSWNYSAVPEVSNVLAGALLAAGLLRRKRRAL